MLHYQAFLDELMALADENYRDFHKRLLNNDKINVLGVRIPQLRKVAKKYKNEIEELMAFPDDVYEVTFVKLTAVSLLKFDGFLKYADKCVSLIDNWATCDCFAPKCIAKNKEEFLPYIYKYLSENKEFYQRFALTTLLHFYVEEEYLENIYEAVRLADTQIYYVHMAAAWLICETAVKFYDRAVEFLKADLKENLINIKTHNKAIQKACESFRLSNEQKIFLKGLKR